MQKPSRITVLEVKIREAGYSNRQFAKKIGVAPSTVGHWQRGIYKNGIPTQPEVSLAIMVADILGCPITDLWTRYGVKYINLDAPTRLLTPAEVKAQTEFYAAM
jgi:DNA-binding XRE family transcriptional regulator